MRNLLVGAAVLASIAQTATAATFTAQDLLHGFNNIVLTDLHATAETEGTIFVGGNYSGGATVNPDLEPNVDLGGGVVGTFVVGGDVTGIANLQSGNAQVGGSITGTINNNGGGTINTGVSVPVATVRSTLEQLSLDLSTNPDTAGGVANTSDQNNINFVSGAGDSDMIQFFNITASVLANGTFNGITAPAGVTTIINVSGTAPVIGVNANQTLTDVLFNFYEATSLTINTAFNYSILAPFADVTQNGGGINGTVVSNNLRQNAEIRPGHFDGNLPNDNPQPVPVPPALALLASAFAGVGLLKRRSK